MSSERRVNPQDLFAEASKAADELYNIRETYFPPNPDDKTSKLNTDSTLALQLLDSIPPEKRKSPMQRATYEYLRGKILDVFPEYKKEAEDHLSKAVKLNPSLIDAWLSLGNCIWKKGDLASAKNCYTLALSKGPNKRILSQLSMLERGMAQGKSTENQAEIVEESVKHAKEAVTLDVKDGNSWYNLGNACLTSFFVSGAWDQSKLLQSLKAYQHAEKDKRMESNPDLYYNSATVNKYLENYERALSGFEAAALKDPGLNAMEEVQNMVHLLDKIESLLCTKAKRLASLTSSLATFNLHPAYTTATIDCLLEGLNKAVAIVGKVLFFVKQKNVAPFYYVLCDSSQICYVLSVYRIHNEAIKEGDQVTLLEPFYKSVDFSWKGKCYKFKSVRVDFLEQVIVNGKTLSNQHAVQTSIYAQNKP
ncbi:tetratricopeptide repeat 5-like [Olea europaea subsp. europaea]|uniref:Tetratricopeptide repeat 5-like n=1 Tax=Olea europaea subsp. europaea TaxID=158383 RepID=A0A8S0RPE1_OLEEU|nr:tetratricopeptide repeat 5-like [Olea europaea subsp. europaea]